MWSGVVVGSLERSEGGSSESRVAGEGRGWWREVRMWVREVRPQEEGPNWEVVEVVSLRACSRVQIR